MIDFKMAGVATVGAVTIALGIGIDVPAHALGFSGDYSPDKFFLTKQNSNGSVLLNDPESITIQGGDNQSKSEGFEKYLTTAVKSGLVSFSWSYITADTRAAFDPFGYVLNNAFIELTNPNLTGQSGSVSFNVMAGDTFGFEIKTTDNTGGRGSATISNFDVVDTPTAVPTPALLPGLLGLGAAALRKRKQEKVEAEV